MTIPPLSLGLIKGAEWLKALNAEMFLFGQAHGHMNKNAEHTSVHALAGRLQAGPSGNLELTVPASLIKGVFDALDEPGAEFVVRNSRTECAIKVMTKEEVDKLGGVSHISERGHSYHYTLGPIVELPASGEYDKLWAISIKSNDLEDIRKSYGLETSPQLGFYIPVGCKKKRVTESNAVSKLAGVYTASGEKVQGVGLRKMYHSLLEEQGLPGLGVNNEDTGDVELSFDGDEAKRQEVFDQLSSRVQAKTGHPVTFAPVDIPQSSVPVKLTNKDTERLNAIHHLAYRMSNMYDPADPLLDSNDSFKQKLADRFRLQVSPRGIKGTVPSRAAEQLLGTRPMYEGMMPARRTRSEEEALSDMAEEQKRRLMKALSGGRGFLAPPEDSISKLASLLKLSANDQSIGSSSGQPAAAPKPTASSATQPTSPSGNVGAQNTLSGGAGYRQPFNQSASNNLNDMYAKFQKDNPNSPVPQRPAPTMAPSPTPAPSNFAGQADAQLQGNVPIPMNGLKPQGGPISAKQQDMENIKHYQEQANTNIANNRPNTLAAERTRQNDESNQKATEIMGATLGVSRAGDLTGRGVRSVGGQFIKAVTPTIGSRAANVSTGLLGAAAPAAGYMAAENVARASGQNTLGQMGTPTTPVQGVMAAPRFAELAGIDPVGYAKGVPAKITASMGGGPVANTNNGSVSGEVANVPRG